MGAESLSISLSDLDQARFGITVARARVITADDVERALVFCHERGAALLIARCPTSELATAQCLEEAGARLMDTLLYYSGEIGKVSTPADSGNVLVRTLEPGEAEQVEAVAAEAFKEYYGHYHADPRLDRATCDEIYTDWAYRSCLSKEVADEVLVAVLEGEIAGFATLRLVGSEEGEGVLFGVAPAAQGRGVYRSFMLEAVQWFAAMGVKRVLVSTQITNLAVQRVWVRLGFEPAGSYYTFHQWFDGD